MPKKLPEKWINGEKKTLDVLVDLGLKSPRPSLKVYKNDKANTKNLFCRWLPPKEEDIREHKKKRLPYYSTTHTEDPFEAGRFAVSWLKDLIQQIEQEKQAQKYNSKTSLHHYWQCFWEIANSGKKHILSNRRTERKKTYRRNERNNMGYAFWILRIA